MADDPSKRGPQDRSRIDVTAEHECRYWAKELGVSPEKLKDAVSSVGPMVKNVREHLSGSRDRPGR